jgi:hypothetical protein
MGKNAAGRMADRKCEKVGMRLTMEPVVCCGKSDARAIGRKAARNEREGTAEIAAMVNDVWCWRYICDWYGCSHFHDLARSLSSFRRSEPETRCPPSGIVTRAASGASGRLASVAP